MRFAWAGVLAGLSLVWGVAAAAATGEFYLNFTGYDGPPSLGTLPTGCVSNANWRVYESDHFLVYTDKSSDAVVVALAQIAETELAAAKSALGILDSELPIDVANVLTKPHICSSVAGSGSDTKGAGDAFGIAMAALDGPNVADLDRVRNYRGYHRIVRHEITHLIQGLLTKSRDHTLPIDLWFAEGMAQYVTGVGDAIADSMSLSGYLANFANPITLQTRSVMDANGWTDAQIYPGFQLALNFLLDSTIRGGAGNPTTSLKALLQHVGAGQNFSDAFASTFRIQGQTVSLAQFSARFPDRAGVYLSALQSSATVVGASGISVAQLFPADAGCDSVSNYVLARVAGGSFMLNVSALPDGAYSLCFLVGTGGGYGAGTANVGGGKLVQSSFDVSSWPQIVPFPVDRGWWWNPAEGGRGFFIEQRSGTLFIAAYLYDQSGLAQWYVAQGRMTSPSNFSAPLQIYCCGTRIGGAYQASRQTGTAGTVSIAFSDFRHATLTWPGGSIPIERYQFASEGLNLPSPLDEPDVGWWWDPGEPGVGWSIETQNNQIFLTGFYYDTPGNPIWYASSGPLTGDTLFQGTLVQYGNGQSLTGPYRTPNIINANAGQITLQFSSPTTGLLTMPGGAQVPLTRFLF